MLADALLFWANLAEAVLWFAFAAGFAVSAARHRAGARPLRLTAAAAFALFAASDLIEAHTGPPPAWWRPWWLLAWKAACLAAFAVVIASWLRGHHRLRRVRSLRPDTLP